MLTKPSYLELVTKYNKAAAKAVAEGRQVYLHKGKSDVFRVFMKHGALSHPAIINRISKEHGIDTFKRQNRRDNFTKLCLWIAANVCLETRTFSSNGTQGQIAEAIEVDQSTVSRLLELMIKMRVIAPAFHGKHDQTAKGAGTVFDKNGIPFNNVYVVLDDFGYLAGSVAGLKLEMAFKNADQKAFIKTGWQLHERLLTVRNTLWEGTIERRTKNITTGCLKRTIAKITDRSRAVQIIFERMKKRGEDLLLNEFELDRIINARLRSCGFSA